MPGDCCPHPVASLPARGCTGAAKKLVDTEKSKRGLRKNEQGVGWGGGEKQAKAQDGDRVTRTHAHSQPARPCFCPTWESHR